MNGHVEEKGPEDELEMKGDDDDLESDQITDNTENDGKLIEKPIDADSDAVTELDE